MAMGTCRHRQRQGELWCRRDLVEAPGHPFYKKLDEEKIEELLSLLRAVVKEDLEDARSRLVFMRQKYCSTVSNSNAAA